MNIAPSAATQNGFAANPNPSLHTTAPPSQQGQPPEAPMQPTQPLHPEIRSIVHHNLAHAHKVYFSGPLVLRIERQPDGQRPMKDEGWVDVCGKLGGTSLSVWDMEEIAEARKQGKDVPPTYINMTDTVRNFSSCAISQLSDRISLLVCPGLRHRPSHVLHSSPEVFQRSHTQYCQIKPHSLLVSHNRLPPLVGCSLASIRMGKVSSGRGLHCAPDPDQHGR